MSAWLAVLLPLAAATGLRATLSPALGWDLPLALYIPAAMATTWLAGLRAGVLALVLGGVIGNLLFMEPPFRMDLAGGRDLARAGLFVLLGPGLLLASARARRAWEDGRQRQVADERFRLAARAIQGVVYDWDLATDRVFRSEGMADMLGFGPESADPSRGWWMERVHPEDRERLRAQVEAALEGGASHFTTEYRVRHADDRLIRILDQGHVLRDASGRPLRVVGFRSDVTERHQAEEDLRLADRRKDDFMATLAHELRNPLAAATGALDLLERNPRSDEARALLGRQLDQLARLLDDLLDVSRISRGKIQLRMEPLDLAGVARRAAAAVEVAAAARDHELLVRLPREPLGVLGDDVRLEQVLVNLLANAIKYTPPGGLVELAGRREEEEVVVLVKDTGMGIEPEMLPRVFDLFTQAPQALDRSQGGLGLGLALSAGLAELHGGRLAARSEGRGKGSEFELRLPARAGSLPEEPPPPAPAPPRGRRVLVVEDNPDAAWALSEVLEACGHDVLLARTGPDGLRQALEELPEVVLLDIGLPGMDGLHVAQELRKTEAGRKMTLVALSGYGQPQDRERSLRAGFDRHLVKPVHVESLLEVLE